MKAIKYLLLLPLAFPMCLFAQGITIGSGTTFSLGGATFSLPGNWNNNGTFVAGSGTIVLNGPTGDQTITKANGETFGNLTVNKAAGDVKLANNVVINGTLTLTSGDIDLSGMVITLGASAMLAETPGNTVKGTGSITGTASLNAPASVNVLGLGAIISSSANLGSTTIVRTHVARSGNGNTGILRSYQITPTVNTGLQATLVFSYDQSELNGKPEATLGLYKSTDGGSTWIAMGGTVNTGQNTVRLTNINDFSLWTLADLNNPLAVAGPILVSPLNGATGISTSPTTFTWNASPGAASYELQISTAIGFVPLIVDSSGITVTTCSLRRLAILTTYYWRVVATSAYGSSASSATWSFMTASSTGPIVTNAAVSNLTTTSVRLNGTVNPQGSNTWCYFVYGTTTDYGDTTSTIHVGGGTTASNVNVSLANLFPATLYHYRIVAWSNAGTTEGADATFMTSSIAGDIPLTITDGAGGTQQLGFGMNVNATDGLDRSLGEAELPPVPATGTFDARFVGDDIGINLGQGSLKDYRQGSSSTAGTKVHEIQYQVGSGSSITISWNFAGTAVTSGRLQDLFNGSVVDMPMSVSGSYTVTKPGVVSKLKMTIRYGGTVAASAVNVSAGWNIISIPVQAADMSLAALFPDVSSPAYGYSNGFVAASTLSTGKGYWLKAPAAKSYPVSGDAVRPPNIAVDVGWNIIGGYDFDIPTSSITSSTVPGPFYGYNNGYVIATTLSAGIGYWVKASAAATLTAQVPSANIVRGPEKRIPEQTAASLSITLEDNSGQRGVLFMSEAGCGSELPPIPPQGVFDVRFAGNTSIDADGIGDHEILLNSVVYPVSVVAQGVGGRELWLNDGVGGMLVNAKLEEGKAISITQNLSKIVISEKNPPNEIPQEYQLSQNYPNPFNPTTMIQYALPVGGHVMLSVYNALGERVAILVDGERTAGTHQVQFDAANMSSGVYYYRLTVNAWVMTRKMVVVK